MWAISWAIVKADVSPVSSFTLQLLNGSQIEPKLANPSVSHGLSELTHKSTLYSLKLIKINNSYLENTCDV